MIVKIFKAVWFFSLLAAVGVLLYAYASYPETIQLTGGNPAEGETISRDGLFYASLGVLAVLNSLVFVVSRVMTGASPLFHAWFYGLIVFFNLFMIVALEFFNLYNSNERFDYASIGYIIYGSVALIILWASLWPLAKVMAPRSANQAIPKE